MVGKTNRGWSEMGLGPWSHGSYLFIIGPMGTFVFFALGCLDGEVQTTIILWNGKSADSLVGSENSGVFLSHKVLPYSSGLVISISKNRSVCSRGGVEQASVEFGLISTLPSSSFALSLFLSEYLHELRLNRPVLPRFYDLRIMVSHPKPALVGRVASSG